MQSERVERRRFPRYQVDEGVLATAKHVLGPIQDISLGGMSFEYYQEAGPAVMNGHIGIMHPALDFWLDHIPCRVVNDHLVTTDFFAISAARKRRCVAFLDLTPEQQLQLADFIQHSSVAPA